MTRKSHSVRFARFADSKSNASNPEEEWPTPAALRLLRRCWSGGCLVTPRAYFGQMLAMTASSANDGIVEALKRALAASLDE